MKYSVTNLNDKNYNLIGIKLSNGKTCCYWSNKGNNEFDKVIVIFDNKNVVDVKDGQVCISLNGIDQEEDILDMIEAFGRELYNDKINITKLNCDFIVDNKDEELIVSNVMNKFMLKGDIVKSEKYSYLTENLDDAISNISVFSDSREKKNREYDSHDLDADAIVNKKKKLLSDWMNDSDMLLEIGYLSREELDKKLTDAVMSNNIESGSVDDSADNIDNNIDDSIDDGAVDEVLDKIDKVDYLEDSSEYPKLDDIVGNVKKHSRVIDDEINEDIPGIYKENSLNSSFSTNEKDSLRDEVDSRSSSVDDYFWGKDEFKGDSLLSRNDRNDLPVREDVSSSIGSNVRVLKKPDRPIYPIDDKKKKISLPLVIFIVSFVLLLLSVVILYLIK